MFQKSGKIKRNDTLETDSNLSTKEKPYGNDLSCRRLLLGTSKVLRYNDEVMNLEELLDYYFMVIDPLSVNRQGNDIGIQYRTGIYYTDEAQLPVIRKVYERQQDEVGKPLAVAIEPIRNFFSAEEYHQKYLDKNPGGYCHIPRSYFSLADK